MVKIRNGNKVTKLFLAAFLIFGLFNIEASERVYANDSETDTSSTEVNETEESTSVEPSAAPTTRALTFDPINVADGDDGYGYIRVASTTDTYYDEKIYQYWYQQWDAGYGVLYYVDQNNKWLYSTGDATGRALGRPATNTAAARIFAPVVMLGDLEGDIINMQTGDGTGGSTILLTSTGQLWYTGDGGAPLGSSATFPSEDNRFVKFPQSVMQQFDGQVVDIHFGADGTFYLTDKGTLYTYDSDARALFGTTMTDNVLGKTPNPDGSGIKKIWGDKLHRGGSLDWIIALTNAGNLYGAGYGDDSRAFGTNGSTNGWHRITQNVNGVESPIPTGSVVDVADYVTDTTYILKNDGSVWAAGTSSGFPVTGHLQNVGTAGYKRMDQWGNNVIQIYPGDVTALVKRNFAGDEQMWYVGENYRDLGTTAYGSCTEGGPAVCNSREIMWTNDPANPFHSTNWNKTEIVEYVYSIGGYDNTITIDQDGLLRAGGYTSTYNTMAYNAQGIFPPVRPESTIRTVENNPNTSDSSLSTTLSANNVSSARVQGEYKLYDTIYLAKPAVVFENGSGTVFGTDEIEGNVNPHSMTIGPKRGDKFAFNSNPDSLVQFDVYMDYVIWFANPATGERTTKTTISGTNHNLNNGPVNIDLQAIFNAHGYNTYTVEMLRHTTNDEGEYYVSERVFVPFQFTREPSIVVDPLVKEVDENTTLPYKFDEGVKALFGPYEDISSKIFIKDYAPKNPAFTEVTATIDGVSRVENYTINKVDETTVGVYNVTYAVDVTESALNYTAEEKGIIVVNDGTIEVGEDYILSAKDYLMSYTNFSDTDDDIKAAAKVRLWKKNADGLFEETTDLSDVVVDKTGWVQTEGLSVPITFSANKLDGSGVDVSRTVTGKIDNMPTITFTADTLGIKAAGDSLVAEVTANDVEDGAITAITTEPASSSAFVSGKVYPVTYTVTDSHGNVTTETRAAYIDDGKVKPVGDYLVIANDYEVRAGQIDNSDDAIIAASDFEVFDKAGNVVDYKSLPGFDIDPGTYVPGAGEGEYTVTFKLTATDSTTITVTVIGGSAPTISGKAFEEVSLDDLAAYDAFKTVSVSDAEDDDAVLKNDLKVSPDMSTITTDGVYKLTFTVTDSDGNAAEPFERVLLVNDGTWEVGTEDLIKAVDFDLMVREVDAGAGKDAQVKTESGVVAYSKLTGEKKADSTINVSYGIPAYAQANGIYPITFTSGTASITINATVASGTGPEISGTDFAEIKTSNPVGTYDETAGITITDDTDSQATLISSMTASPKLDENSAPGIYVVEYTTLDSDFNPSNTFKRTVLVNDGTYTVGDKYIAKAADYKILSGAVAGTGAAKMEQAKDKSGFEVYLKTTGAVATGVTVVTDLGDPEYSSVKGSYGIKFEVMDGVKVDVTSEIVATVESGGIPVISTTKQFEEVQQGNLGTYDPMTYVTVSDSEDDDAVLKTKIVVSPTIDATTNPGVYVVTYDVKDSDGNNAETLKRTILVNDGTYVVGNSHIIKATDFSLNAVLVDTANLDAQAIEKGLVEVHVKATGEKLVSPNVKVTYGSPKYTNAEGKYDITFTFVADSAATIDIVATVDSENVPVISSTKQFEEVAIGSLGSFNAMQYISVTDVEDNDAELLTKVTVSPTLNASTPAGVYTLSYNVTDSDGNAAETYKRTVLVNDGTFVAGDTHIIKATDFIINSVDVNNADKPGQIAKEGKVEVYAIADGSKVVNPVLNVTYSGNQYSSTPGVYNINVAVAADPKANIGIVATVTSANIPVISSTLDFEEVALGAMGSFNAMQYISVTDVEDNDAVLKASVTVSPVLNASSAAGVYTLTYNVTDSDGNAAVPYKRTVLVNDGTFVVGATHIIRAKDFNIASNLVDKTTAKVAAEASVEVYAKDTGERVNNPSLRVTFGTPEYSNAAGDYDITFTFIPDSLATIKIVATVEGGNFPVITGPTYEKVKIENVATYDPKATITVTDVEDDDATLKASLTCSPTFNASTQVGMYKVDCSVTDSSGNTTTFTKTVLVDDGTFLEGTVYVIRAIDFTIKPGAVETANPARKAQILSKSETQVYLKSDGSLVSNPNINIVDGVVPYTNVNGSYDIGLKLMDGDRVDVTAMIVATVHNGDVPVISGTNFVEINIDNIASLDLTAGVTATDFEDGNITASITNDAGVTTSSPAGVYQVKYNVVDSEGNDAETFTRTYLINDGTYAAGNNYIVKADDFELTTSQVAKKDKDTQAKTESEFTVYDMVTGKVTSDATVKVTYGNPVYTNAVGTYPITFTTSKNGTDDAKITINANVTGGNLPEINGGTFVEINVGASFDPTAGVTATDVEDGDITFDKTKPAFITYTSDVNVDKAGIYKVVYTVKDTDGNIVDLTRVVLVNDGTFKAGTDYIIEASNFMVEVNDVDTGGKAGQVLDKSGSKVYDKATGDLSTEVASVSFGTPAYTNIIGKYDITLSVGTDVSIDILGIVFDGDTTVIDGNTVISAENFTITVKEAAKMTQAILDTNSKVVAHTITPYEVIDYKLTTTSVKMLETIKTAGVGVYPFEYTATSDKTVSKTIFVAVKDDNTVIDNTNNELLKADNFVMTLTEAYNKTNAMIKKLANVVAMSTLDGTTLDVNVTETIPAVVGEYPVKFATDAGTERDVIGKVYDPAVGTVVGDIYIEGIDFELTPEQAKLLDLAGAKLNGQVSAKKISTMTDLEAKLSQNSVAVLKTINEGVMGVYPLTFTATDGVDTASKTIYVSVNSGVSANDEILDGSDFIISVDDVATLDSAKAVELSKAEAYDTKTADPVAVTANVNNVKPMPGSYSVNLSTEKGTNMDVKAKVFSEVTTQGDITIAANDFTMTVDEVASFTVQGYKDRANATAVYVSTNLAAPILSVDYSKVTAVAGDYEVTFTSENNVRVTVIATVQDKGVVDPSTGEKIYASNFRMSVEEVGTLATSEYIERANAKAYDKDLNPISIDKVNTKAISPAPGKYPVRFELVSGVFVDVEVEVFTSSVVANGEEIHANDFNISIAEFASMTSASYISRANAKAFVEGTNQVVTITTVDSSSVKGEKGEYPVTFSTAKGTSVTVNATVYDNGTVNPTNKEEIFANDIIMSVKEVGTFTPADYIARSEATAKNTETNAPVEITSVVTNAVMPAVGTYSAKFVTAKGTETTIKVEVVDESTSANGESIYANNFRMTVADVASFTDAKYVETAEARAFIENTSTKVDITVVDSSKVVAVAGDYPVTFKTAKGTTVTVIATVYDQGVVNPTTGEEIFANNFDMTIDEVGTLTPANYIERAEAVAYNTDDNTAVTVANVDSTKITAIAGEYDVTFSTAKGTTVVVKANVYDEGTTDPSTGESIFANNFRIGVEEVGTLGNKAYIELAGAKATDKDGNAIAIDNVDASAIKPEVGVYPVVFTTANGTSVTVEVEVFTTTEVANGEKLYANDFKLTVEEVSSITNAEYVAKAKAQAYDENTNVPITVNLSDKSKVKAEVGVYDVTYATAKGTTITVKATVYTEGTVNPTNKEEIFANDFKMTITDVATFKDANYIAKSGAVANDVDTKNNVEVTTVDSTKVKGEAGKYEVTFATAKGTSVTVTATVYDDGTVNVINNEEIFANNFKMSVEEVGTLSDADMIARADANANVIGEATNVDVTKVDSSAIVATAGNYDVTFSTAKGTSVTVSVEVYDHGTTNPTTGEDIYANNFRLSVEEVASITDAEMIKRSSAVATAIEDGTEVAITTVDSSNVKAVIGTYDVTFKTAKGTEITVSAEVFESSSIKNNEEIYANGFSMTVAEAKAFTASNYIENAKAQAYVEGTNTPVAIKAVDYKAVKPVPGDYTVNFATAKGTNVDVNVNVYDHGTVNPSTSESIHANNFVVSLEAAPSLTADQAKTLSEVIAKNVDTQEIIDIDSVDVSKVNAATEAGSYDVTFTTAAGTELTVKAIVGNNVVIADGYAISADDIAYTTTQIRDLKARADFNADVIEKSGAKVWIVESNLELNPVLVNTNAVDLNNPTIGLYTATYSFAAPSGTIVTEAAINITESALSLIASGFTVTTNEAKDIDGAKILELAGAEAKDHSGTTPTDLPVEIKDLDEVLAELNNAKPGVYPIVVTATDGVDTEEITIYATVHTDNGVTDKDSLIDAYPIRIPVSDAKKISNANLIELAEAKSWSRHDGTELKVSVKSSTIKAVIGTYDVTFINTNGLELTIDAIVYDHVNKDTETGEGMAGNNFVVSPSDIDSLTLDDAIAKSDAEAWVLETNEPVDITNIDKSNVKDEVGSYDIILTTDAGTELVVKVIVGENVVVVDGYAISANDIVFSNTEIESFNGDRKAFDAEVIERSKTAAFVVETSVKVSPVIVDSTQVNLDTATLGIYDGTYKLDTTLIDLSTVATIEVIVSDIEVNADGFTVTPEEALTLTANDINDLTGIEAKKISDGTDLGYTMVDEADTLVAINSGEIGLYPVTYEATDGVTTEEITVYAAVLPEDAAHSDEEALVANDFAVAVDQVSRLNDSKIIEKSGAKAWNKLTGEEVSVNVIYDNVSPKAGEYTVIVATEDGLEKEITVTVYDHLVVDPKTGITIGANNFTISDIEVPGLNNDKVKTLASVKAWNTKTNKPVDVTKVDFSDIKKRVGDYDVIFGTQEGTEVTVIATVIKAILVDIPDPKFRACLNEEYLGQPATADIYSNQLEGITEDIECSGVEDLTGAENLTGTDTIIIKDGSIDDIGPLKDLTDLEHLDLSGNDIEDISDIATLPNLRILNLERNNIIDPSPVAELRKLDELYLAYNAIGDISKLDRYGNLVSLSKISLNDQTVELPLVTWTDVNYTQNYEAIDHTGTVIKYNESKIHPLSKPTINDIVNTWRVPTVKVGNIDNIMFDGIVKQTVLRSLESEAMIQYRSHVQREGWNEFVNEGYMSGTVGSSLRLEAFELKFTNPELAQLGDVEYRTHIQQIGWEGKWASASKGEMSGSQGRSLRLEAFQIRLTDQLEEQYDVYYRTHVQMLGWLDWAMNGEAAGSAGYSFRMEAIQIDLVPKGTTSSYIENNNNPLYNTGYVTNDLYVNGLYGGSEAWTGYKRESYMAGNPAAPSTFLKGIQFIVNAEWNPNIPGYTTITNPSYDSGIEVTATLAGSITDSHTFGFNTQYAKEYIGVANLPITSLKISINGEMKDRGNEVYFSIYDDNGWSEYQKGGSTYKAKGKIKSIQMRVLDTSLEPIAVTFIG